MSGWSFFCFVFFTSFSTMISSASTIVDSLWAMNTDVLSLTISLMELKMFWEQEEENRARPHTQK